MLTSTSAWANKIDYSGVGEVIAIFVLGLGLSLVVSVGSLIVALVMGRRAAPRAPWKRTVAVVIIVVASLCAAMNLGASGIALWLGLALASSSEVMLVVVVVAVICGVPLSASIGAIIWSAKMYGRNKTPRCIGEKPA